MTFTVTERGESWDRRGEYQTEPAVTRLLTALVVEPPLADSLFITDVLTSAGFQVTAANFAEARARLSVAPPHLLVVDVCQRQYNGLHLVIRGIGVRSGMAPLVTCSYADIVLQRESERLGAAYIVKPITREELLAAAARTIWRDRETLVPIRPPFERRRGERRQMASLRTNIERRRSERRRPLELSLV
jgi:DNA-binding response OmpR family regulator